MSSDGLSCSTANDNDVKYYSLENMIQESKLGKVRFYFVLIMQNVLVIK